jgi:hypothetical protein
VISGTLSGIIPRPAGGGWPGLTGGGAWVSVRSRSKEAGLSRRVTAWAQDSLTPGRQGEAEGGGDPQHISLAVLFTELAQFGAIAVDLVAAQVTEPGAAGTHPGADINGKLALGAKPKVQRQAPAGSAAASGPPPTERSSSRCGWAGC